MRALKVKLRAISVSSDYSATNLFSFDTQLCYPSCCKCNVALQCRAYPLLQGTDVLYHSSVCFTESQNAQSGAARGSTKRARPTSRRIPAIQKTLAVFVQVQFLPARTQMYLYRIQNLCQTQSLSVHDLQAFT
jgi:hypothetical protein